MLMLAVTSTRCIKMRTLIAHAMKSRLLAFSPSEGHFRSRAQIHYHSYFMLSNIPAKSFSSICLRHATLHAVITHSTKLLQALSFLHYRSFRRNILFLYFRNYYMLLHLLALSRNRNNRQYGAMFFICAAGFHFDIIIESLRYYR